MNRRELTDKLIVLGVDGFDPRLAKKFMDQGKMPALQEFVNRGAAREDLVLLGAMPTVTPPMWTTLATGAYPMTHGITAFFNQHPTKLDTTIYALDSRMCKAEPVWNVLAEAGKNTLVWHWPGSSWPPTSDSPNLSVVDGTQPACVDMGVAVTDWETLGKASEEIEELKYVHYNNTEEKGMAGCVITGLEDTVAKEDDDVEAFNGAEAFQATLGAKETTMLAMDDSMTEINMLGKVNTNNVYSPIREAQGWADAPADAKEFTILTSEGLIRRPCLILKNVEGIYDRIAVYKSKKDTTPMVELKAGEFKTGFLDEVVHNDEKVLTSRNVCLMNLAEDGSYLDYSLGIALDVNNTDVWHPKALHEEIVNNVGYHSAISQLSGSNPEHAEKVMITSWDHYGKWQADALTYLMDTGRYDVIFSHFHNVDLIGHQIWHFAKHRDEWGNDEVRYQKMIERVYVQTDNYLNEFLKYLDQGWTIIITSDHGLITEENHPPVLVEGCISIPVMRELGYTVMKKDKDGNDRMAIDWTKTRAIAARGGHIYLNLKDKYDYGIVTEEEKYDLEAQIISDLYNYRDPRTGKRVVALALRNRDARIIGMGGEECGDIVFFMEEGFNIIHMDSLSTQRGYFDTSVSPIFVAAGPGIKEGYRVERDIRQVDVAPTVAVLTGVRMPVNNEGSVMHQILTEEF